MRESNVGPHLVPKHNVKLCSICGKEFPLDVKPSLGQAFAEHVRKEHMRMPLRLDEKINIKAILLTLVGASEDLAASQTVVIAILRAQSKGKVSAAHVRSATEQAKSSNRRSYDGLRKAIAEISSDTN